MEEEEEEEEEEGVTAHPGGAGPEGRSGFFGMYSMAMEEQLGGTRMAESFDRGETVTTAARGDAQPGGHAGDNEPLRPVDLDMNLVKSLLRSVAAQQGNLGRQATWLGCLAWSCLKAWRRGMSLEVVMTEIRDM